MVKLRKSLLVLAFIVVSASAFGFSVPRVYAATAATNEQLQLQIADLMQKIVLLMQELIKLQSTNQASQNYSHQNYTQNPSHSYHSEIPAHVSTKKSDNATSGISSRDDYGDDGKDYFVKDGSESTFNNDNGSSESDNYTES